MHSPTHKANRPSKTEAIGTRGRLLALAAGAFAVLGFVAPAKAVELANIDVVDGSPRSRKSWAFERAQECAQEPLFALARNANLSGRVSAQTTMGGDTSPLGPDRRRRDLRQLRHVGAGAGRVPHSGRRIETLPRARPDPLRERPGGGSGATRVTPRRGGRARSTPL